MPAELVYWAYFAFWPVEALVGVPFMVVALKNLPASGRQLGIKNKKRFIWSGSIATVLLFPALFWLSDIELGDIKPPELVASPDTKWELLFSFRSTSRSLDFIDPSCRVYVQLRNRVTGEIAGKIRINVLELGDIERPKIEWLQDKVIIQGHRQISGVIRLSG